MPAYMDYAKKLTEEQYTQLVEDFRNSRHIYIGSFFCQMYGINDHKLAGLYYNDALEYIYTHYTQEF